ncbi:MAG: VWA-like domain-containing protein [Gammaproteobacteria bacterium]|nr:VWA-like domain-containing protein [Gammaproteobacteria bacterium]
MADLDAEKKLSAARTQLILSHPFLGTLVLRFKMAEADAEWCHSTATDAKTFFYNKNFIRDLSISQTQFMLAHEALHCALSHFVRKEGRKKNRWDVACDYAINPILKDEGLEAPRGILYEESYRGMSAEEIYPFIDDQSDDETIDQHIYDQPQEQGQNENPQQQDSGSCNQDKQDLAKQPPPLQQQERNDLAQQWQQYLAGAAQTARQAGKLSGGLARLVDHYLDSRLPWRQLLSQFMSASARDDYSYVRPSTRRGDPAIFPSLRSHQINLTVAIDTSNSIKEKELNEFLSEINTIKAQIKARVTLLACDSELAQDVPWVFEPWECLSLPPNIYGGGGTAFEPVFDWIAQQDMAPDLLVYFTDAQGSFPKQTPYYPVAWLVKGKARVPWGQRIQLN